MSKVETLAFVRPFYQRTLGFWAFALIVGGVFMEVGQHVLLGRFFFKSPIAFWILPICVIVFGLVHLRIQLGLLRSKEYLIFHHLGLLPKTEFLKWWSKIILANYSLTLAYLLFLSHFAWELNNWSHGLILWLTVVGMVFFTFTKIRKTVSNPLSESIIRRPPIHRTFPRFSWILLSVRQHRPLLLLLSKVLSLLLLNGVYYSFQTGIYDFRWLEFGTLVLAYTQLPLLLEKAESEIKEQSWLLSLPLKVSHKAGYHLGSIALLILPELLFLGWKGWNSGALTDYLILSVLTLAFLIALHLLVYWDGLSTTFVQKLAGVFFLFFFAILFGLPWLLLCMPIVILFHLHLRSSYRF